MADKKSVSLDAILELYWLQNAYIASGGTLECIWGFGNNMVGYLLKGQRRLKHRDIKVKDQMAPTPMGQM